MATRGVVAVGNAPVRVCPGHSLVLCCTPKPLESLLVRWGWLAHGVAFRMEDPRALHGMVPFILAVAIPHLIRSLGSCRCRRFARDLRVCLEQTKEKIVIHDVFHP